MLFNKRLALFSSSSSAELFRVNPGHFAPKAFPPLVVSSPRRFPPHRFTPTSRFTPIVNSPLVYIRSSVGSDLGLNCLHAAKVAT